MDFGLSEQQQKWHDAAVRLAREDLVDPDGPGREQRGEFWREGYERCGKAGILGLPVPSEFGGQGADIPTAVAAIQATSGCDRSFSARACPRPMMAPAIPPEINAAGIVAAGPPTR